MRTDAVPPPTTVAEYLAYEADGRVRHEYIAGEIFAMTGASGRHNRIAGNFFAAVDARVRGGPCRVYMSDLKVRLKIGADDIFYYPDVLVTCVPLEHPYYTVAPTLIVEVLSPTTEALDRREKSLHYRHIPTLSEYVMVAQDPFELTVLRRGNDWKPNVMRGSADLLELQSVDLKLPLTEIYRDLD